MHTKFGLFLLLVACEDPGRPAKAEGALGSIQQTLPADIPATRYVYDGQGRIRSARYPGNRSIIYTYDAAGNRTRRVVQ